MMRIFLRCLFVYIFFVSPAYFFAAGVSKPKGLTKKTPKKGTPVGDIMDTFAKAQRALPTARDLVNGKITSLEEYQAAETALDDVESVHTNLSVLYNAATSQKGTLVGRLADVNIFLPKEAKEILVLKDTLKRKFALLPKPAKAPKEAQPFAPIVAREREHIEAGIKPEEAARREQELRLRLQGEFDEQQRQMRDRYEHELQAIRNQLAERDRVIAQERHEREQQERIRNQRRQQEREEEQRNLARANAETEAMRTDRRHAREEAARIERGAREHEQRAVQEAVAQAIVREKTAHERELERARAQAPAEAPEKQALLAAQAELTRIQRESAETLATKDAEINRMRAQFEQERRRLGEQAEAALRTAVEREKEQSRTGREAAQRTITEVRESLERFERENAAELADARQQIARLQADLKAAQSRDQKVTEAATREKEQLLESHRQDLARLQREHELQQQKNKEMLRAASREAADALATSKRQAQEIERIKAQLAQEREQARAKERAQQAQFEQENERIKQDESTKFAQAIEQTKATALSQQQHLIDQARSEQQRIDEKERNKLEQQLAQLERERTQEQESAAHEAQRMKTENEALQAKLIALERSSAEKQAVDVQKEHVKMKAQIDAERKAMQEQLQQERKLFEQQLKAEQAKTVQFQQQLAQKVVQEERQAQKAVEQEAAARKAHEKEVTLQKQIKKLQDFVKQVQFYRGLEKAQRAKKALTQQHLEQSQIIVNKLVQELLHAPTEKVRQQLNTQLISKLDELGESPEAAKIRANALQQLERGIEQEEVSLVQTIGTMVQGIAEGAKGAPAEKETVAKPVATKTHLTREQQEREQAEQKKRRAERQTLLQHLSPALQQVQQRINRIIDSLAHASESEKAGIIKSLERELSKLGDSPQEIAIREEAEERLKEGTEISLWRTIGNFLGGIASSIRSTSAPQVAPEPELGWEFGAWGRAPELEPLFESRPKPQARPASPKPAAPPSTSKQPFPIHRESEEEIAARRKREKEAAEQRTERERLEQEAIQHRQRLQRLKVKQFS